MGGLRFSSGVPLRCLLLRGQDSVWKQRVERANLEEEMRVARKIRELEMKDQALSAQLSADEEHTKHMTVGAPADCARRTPPRGVLGLGV